MLPNMAYASSEYTSTQFVEAQQNCDCDWNCLIQQCGPCAPFVIAGDYASAAICAINNGCFQCCDCSWF